MLCISFRVSILLTKCISVVAKRKLYYTDRSRDADQMERYYGDFKGSYELYASSWNESVFRRGDSIYIENYKSSSKMLWNLEKKISLFNAENLIWLHFFLWSITRYFLTLPVVLMLPKRIAALGEVLMPQYCSKWMVCVTGSPGKPENYCVACRALRLGQRICQN